MHKHKRNTNTAIENAIVVAIVGFGDFNSGLELYVHAVLSWRVEAAQHPWHFRRAKGYFSGWNKRKCAQLHFGEYHSHIVLWKPSSRVMYMPTVDARQLARL